MPGSLGWPRGDLLQQPLRGASFKLQVSPARDARGCLAPPVALSPLRFRPLQGVLAGELCLGSVLAGESGVVGLDVVGRGGWCRGRREQEGCFGESDECSLGGSCLRNEEAVKEGSSLPCPTRHSVPGKLCWELSPLPAPAEVLVPVLGYSKRLRSLKRTRRY